MANIHPSVTIVNLNRMSKFRINKSAEVVKSFWFWWCQYWYAGTYHLSIYLWNLYSTPSR